MFWKQFRTFRRQNGWKLSQEKGKTRILSKGSPVIVAPHLTHVLFPDVTQTGHHITKSLLRLSPEYEHASPKLRLSMMTALITHLPARTFAFALWSSQACFKVLCTQSIQWQSGVTHRSTCLKGSLMCHLEFQHDSWCVIFCQWELYLYWLCICATVYGAFTIVGL